MSCVTIKSYARNKTGDVTVSGTTLACSDADVLFEKLIKSHSEASQFAGQSNAGQWLSARVAESATALIADIDAAIDAIGVAAFNVD